MVRESRFKSPGGGRAAPEASRMELGAEPKHDRPPRLAAVRWCQRVRIMLRVQVVVQLRLNDHRKCYALPSSSRVLGMQQCYAHHYRWRMWEASEAQEEEEEAAVAAIVNWL